MQIVKLNLNAVPYNSNTKDFKMIFKELSIKVAYKPYMSLYNGFRKTKRKTYRAAEIYTDRNKTYIVIIKKLH